MASTAPYAEFFDNKHLLWIAQEWRDYSSELAEWALERLANRRDVWSQYTVKRGGEIGVVMLPITERRKKGAIMVTFDKLKRHFTGLKPEHIIGLHSISDHSTCKWFAVDIDLHDESIMNADEVAEANFNAAMVWAERVRADGFDPLVFDSNGVGGYHLWCLLDKEYPLADTFDYADLLRSDWEELALPRKPEIFPPKREVKEGDLPYTLRLPGRHPRRPYYTRVRNFDPALENEWLEGGEAIETMMATKPAKLPRSKKRPELEETTPVKRKPAAKKKKVPLKRRRVCVDLDGVLAEYDGWKGPDHFGKPLPGALTFCKKLAEIADIVVFTSRCSDDPGAREEAGGLSPGQVRIKVIDWLEKHKFPFTDVYIGHGKPRVDAFIDDRGIACRPQSDPKAFATALADTKALLKKGAKD
ncbi:MAG: hypothetical protein JO053_14900 [Acidobacteria bacterium]|nr:hypothetical protein [Acidobacteriota bacterium]